MIWTPHATVATIVESDGKLLMVEELSYNMRVFNQPAGHIEQNESIFEAAIRETREETGWLVKLKGFIGSYTYTAPENGITYYRFCFSADVIDKVSDQLDQDIIAAHWMTPRQIAELGEQLRSPLVMRCITDYFEREHLPLSYIYEHPSAAT